MKTLDKTEDYLDARDLHLRQLAPGTKVFARQANASNFIGARIISVNLFYCFTGG